MTSSSLLPPVLTIGDWPAKFVWLTRAADEAGTERVGALPAAVLIEHPPSFGAPAHTMLVPWVPVEGSPGEPFTLESLASLAPLTVVQPVTCSICGVSGRIESGAWLPTEGGGRG